MEMISPGSIPPLDQPQPLSERVYRAILQMLARASLRRGSTLRIDVLARALKVSPTPVREALARLAATGLVRHEARKGYTVAPAISAENLRKLMVARRLLEVGAVGVACEEGGEPFRRALVAAFVAQSAAVDRFHAAVTATLQQRDELSWALMESDLHFHQVIFDHTHNSFLNVMADALCAQLHRVRQSAEAGITDDLHALAEHKTILDAIIAKDRAKAEAAMLRHMDNLEQRSVAEIPLTGESEAVDDDWSPSHPF
jgi:DNA-binding GntR family transcriptional regulator